MWKFHSKWLVWNYSYVDQIWWILSVFLLINWVVSSQLNSSYRFFLMNISVKFHYYCLIAKFGVYINKSWTSRFHWDFSLSSPIHPLLWKNNVPSLHIYMLQKTLYRSVVNENYFTLSVDISQPVSLKHRS